MLRSIILVSALAFTTLTSFAQTTSFIRKIEVTGTATEELQPNIIYLSFTTKEYTDGKGKVSLDATEKEIKKAMTQFNIPSENLTVQNVYGYVTYDHGNNKPGAFESRKTYRLKLSDVTKVTPFLSTIERKAMESANIDQLSHTELEKHEKMVKVKAMKAAQEKAAYILQSVNEQPGRVLEIQEITDMNRFQPMINMKMMDAEADFADNSAIESQKIKIQFQMRVVYEIK